MEYDHIGCPIISEAHQCVLIHYLPCPCLSPVWFTAILSLKFSHILAQNECFLLTSFYLASILTTPDQGNLPLLGSPPEFRGPLCVSFSAYFLVQETKNMWPHIMLGAFVYMCLYSSGIHLFIITLYNTVENTQENSTKAYNIFCY